MGGSVYVMSDEEVVAGLLVGHVGPLAPAREPSVTPREALERVVRVALQRPPCGVAFSGGRDSSVVLAVATHVARRDGLPDPVPVTRVFPDVAESQEHEWQETVVRHLGLREWERVELHDELDVVGPLAARHLLRHGVVWPPTIAGDIPLVDAVRGGSMMDGEGGDEVFGVGAHRIAPLTFLVRSPRPLRWRRIRAGAVALAPASVRAMRVRRRWADAPLTWLRPHARRRVVALVEQAERDAPLRFAASVRRVPTRRTQVLGARNRDLLCEPSGVRFTSPLLDSEVVHALARDGGSLGRGDRTTVLRRLASDLLPDAVLSRVSKATFTTAYMGRHTREFASAWDGDGVDTAHVDADELRRIWMSERPNALTAALLQRAWLASRAARTATRSQHSGVAPETAC